MYSWVSRLSFARGEEGCIQSRFCGDSLTLIYRKPIRITDRRLHIHIHMYAYHRALQNIGEVVIRVLTELCLLRTIFAFLSTPGLLGIG